MHGYLNLKFIKIKEKFSSPVTQVTFQVLKSLKEPVSTILCSAD